MNIYQKSECILFNSYLGAPDCYLSNMYECNLKIGRWRFHSAEQIFFCLLFSDFTEIQRELYQESSPHSVKRLGSHYQQRKSLPVSDMDKWKILRLAQTVKFFQSHEFRQFLLDKNNRRYTLVEYAWWGDSEAGAVDVDISHKEDLQKGELRGYNKCGKLLMQIRDKFIGGDMKSVKLPELNVTLKFESRSINEQDLNAHNNYAYEDWLVEEEHRLKKWREKIANLKR